MMQLPSYELFVSVPDATSDSNQPGQPTHMRLCCIMSSTEDDSSVPILPSDSPGSSVSTTLQDEYQELLKYAVVAPNYDPTNLPQSLAQAVHAFSNRPRRDELIFEDSSVTSTPEKSASADTSRDKESEQALQGSNSEVESDYRLEQTGDEITPVRPSLLAAATPETPETDESSVSDTYTSRSSVMSPSIDQDLAKMEANLDNWCLDMKRNILAEMSQSKISLIERHRQEIRAIKDRHNKEVNQLQNEIENLKELLHTYEVSIERKDGVVSNLTRALQRQKERFEMLKRFQAWKLRHTEDRREAFTSKLAVRQRERHLMTKVWGAWHSVIEAKWKQRVEKACQSKAQEVCMSLTNDYETRLASLNEALESSRAEVTRLHSEREMYEETMKKAFMRGVCALNLEAMTMFHENEENDGGRCDSDNAATHQPSSATLSIPTPTQTVTNTKTTSQPRTVTSQSATTPGTLTQSVGGSMNRVTTTRTTHRYKPPKTITARISTRPDSGKMGQQTEATLAPPMSSVMVERHHPIIQQTIGHALASKYPQATGETSHGSTGARQPLLGNSHSNKQQLSGQISQQSAGVAKRKIPGQSGRAMLAESPNIHTVKVVH
ncbi:centrosomal protein POC5-like isoform X2 [Patiria miniata]|uniref:Centrosomal protein POC5 n=2 Tax=Patiria miniata TaxID=46514 RepID=A0A914BPZ0_PATMI|nr:centrosomal protein POC5-like isoform X2 [Patiria miniata]